MDPALSALLFRVYRGIRTDIAAAIEAVFPVATFPAENAEANTVLEALVVFVRRKASDDGLRDAVRAFTT